VSGEAVSKPRENPWTAGVQPRPSWVVYPDPNWCIGAYCPSPTMSSALGLGPCILPDVDPTHRPTHGDCCVVCARGIDPYVTGGLSPRLYSHPACQPCTAGYSSMDAFTGHRLHRYSAAAHRDDVSSIYHYHRGSH